MLHASRILHVLEVNTYTLFDKKIVRYCSTFFIHHNNTITYRVVMDRVLEIGFVQIEINAIQGFSSFFAIFDDFSKIRK